MATTAEETAPPFPGAPGEEWRVAANGRHFITVPGVGTLWRSGDETVAGALVRQQVRREEKAAEAGRPKRGPGRPKGKGRKADRPPRVEPTASKPEAKAKASKEQLAAAAEVPLRAIGGFVGHQVLGCAWCAQSMQSTAPMAARDLANTDNAYMVALLTWWHGVMATILAGGSGIPAYLVPPLLHHGPIPDPMYAMVSGVMGMPPRAARPAPHAHDHQPGPPRAETQPAPGVDTRPPSPQPGTPPPPAAGNGQPAGMTPQDAARLAQEEMSLRQEAARLTSIHDMQLRQAQAARQSQARGPNVPVYRAGQELIPEAPPMQVPGTPQAPPVEPGADAGSPLPPEAGMP